LSDRSTHRSSYLERTLKTEEEAVVEGDTKDRLLEAVLTVVAREGIAGTSARVIAAQAEVNQALIFYHYGTVDLLLAAAARTVSHQRAEVYAQRLERVESFTELAAQARLLHQEERETGNVVVLSQLLAGSRTHPALVPVLRDNFMLLSAPVENTLTRLLTGSPLEGILDPVVLARSVAGGFLGLQLLDGVVTDLETGHFDGLDALAAIVDLAIQANTLETSIIRRKLRNGRAEPTRRPATDPRAIAE
jgi:AcrR family transcriptional regulator